MRTSLAVLALAALFLAGCASAPVNQKPTDPIFVGTTVPVVVAEKCHVEVPAEPAWQVEAAPAAGTNEFEKSKAVLAELEQRRDYENQLKAAAKKCE